MLIVGINPRITIIGMSMMAPTMIIMMVMHQSCRGRANPTGSFAEGERNRFAKYLREPPAVHRPMRAMPCPFSLKADLLIRSDRRLKSLCVRIRNG
jgi:hypothetical protein